MRELVLAADDNKIDAQCSAGKTTSCVLKGRIKVGGQSMRIEDRLASLER